MGFQFLEIKMATGYSDEELRQRIGKALHLKNFTWQIESKSLDARNKSRVHWVLRVGVNSQELKGGQHPPSQALEIPYKKRDKKVIVTGSGPAGFFAAFVLQKAGFDTVILEKGSDVTRREEGIARFEQTGRFDPLATYAFGEGGAGTFSDGKLTSRSKHISAERAFFLSSYVSAGAPEEILYLAYPHVGSDNLRRVVKNLREEYRRMGGEIRFETTLLDLATNRNRVVEAVVTGGSLEADYWIMAPGHSAYDTYRILMRHGVLFRTKNFAIGFRAEHLQADINKAQWGTETLPGVKAAEYRLTSQVAGDQPVYSFCMCPGGMVVPATTAPDINIVNGMSNYRRDGRFANAGCVAGVHPDQLAGAGVTPAGALDWLEDLERSFYAFSGGFEAPFCSITDFINGSESGGMPESSYPLGLRHAPLRRMVPPVVANALAEGLKDFNRRIRGYDRGILLGLESKTSSPIQALREKDGLCSGFENLYIAGEGSGYAGGIVSSAADGIRVAMSILSL